MNRPLGLGTIPLQPPISATHQLTVRQAAAVGVALLMFVTMAGFGAAVIAQPGETLEVNEFLNRFVFGLLVVPCMWGTERFLWRPRVEISDSGVAVYNPIKTAVLPWAEVGGASFDRSLTIVLARGGDRLRSVLFGPAYSSQLTKRTRVDELVALINAEASRRAGRTLDPDAAYEADDLVGNVPTGDFEMDEADAKWRQDVGWPSFVAYLVVWTVACSLVAAL